jgi:hypothetical protein
MFEKELAFAGHALAAGNLAAAEIVCRDIHDIDPRNAAALNLLGILAARVGATGEARRYFEAAVAAAPSDTSLRGNLDFLKHAAMPRVEAGPRYLLIKAWGFGLLSDLTHVLGALLLAEITGRTPVIHQGHNSLFWTGTEVFQNYFEPVSDVTVRDLARIEGAGFFPPKWNGTNLEEENLTKWQGPGSRLGALYFLNRPETIAVCDFYIGVVYLQPWIPDSHPMHGKTLDAIYRYLSRKYLRLNAQAQAACDAFYARHLEGAPFVAVHLRGADKILEDENVHATQNACLAELAGIDPSWRIFALTDDAPLAARVKALHGDRVVLTRAQRSNDAVGIHWKPGVDRFKAGLEVLVDTFLALRADRFLGNGRSNVSTLVAAMKPWKPDHCRIFGDNMLAQRNLYIFAGG